MEMELRRAPAYRGGRPLLVSYTYLADPRTQDKEELIGTKGLNLIQGFGGFADTQMSAFLRDMADAGQSPQHDGSGDAA